MVNIPKTPELIGTHTYTAGVESVSKSQLTPVKVRVQVYIDTGNVHEYEVVSESKGREHAAAIIATGYRSATVNNPNVLTWFPPHRINKVVLVLPQSSNTKYFDKIVST